LMTTSLIMLPAATIITEKLLVDLTTADLLRSGKKRKDQILFLNREVLVNRLKILLKIFAPILVIAVSVLALEYLAGYAIASVALLVSRETNTKIIEDLTAAIVFVARLEGFAAILGILLIQNWKQLEGKGVVRSIFLLISIPLIVFSTIYSLLVISRDVYDKLPSSIGGGKPEYVRFYVNVEVGKRLDALDNTFVDPNAIITMPPDEISANLIITNQLILFWQFKAVDFQGSPTQNVYYFRPANCETCPIIKLNESEIYAVVFENEPTTLPATEIEE